MKSLSLVWGEVNGADIEMDVTAPGKDAESRDIRERQTVA